MHAHRPLVRDDARMTPSEPMRILMVSDYSYPPQICGGSEVSTHDLASMLIKRGHHVAVMAKLEREGAIYYRNRLQSRLTGKAFPKDGQPGYPVYRGWFDDPIFARGLGEIRRDFDPDIAVCQSGRRLQWAIACRNAGLPAYVYLRDTDFNALGAHPGAAAGIRYFANSEFTARRYRDAFGIEARVINPLVLRERYAVRSSGRVALFFNPHPYKGVGIVLALARRRPDIPFVIQQSWRLAPSRVRALEGSIADLPNVELRPWTMDTRPLYAMARIVLVPSQVGEGWGRVVTEAQLSGIPALASDSGALPESVGTGGITLPRGAPIDDWLAALGRLWDDQECWETYSRAALASADRPELQPEYQVGEFEAELAAALAGRRTAE